VSDAQRRALRTLIQVGFVQALMQLWNAFSPPLPADLTPEQMIAITTIGTPLVAFAQNWLEDNTTAPALLKAPASRGENPMPDDVDPHHIA
jgi:hypothetical protein